MAPYLITKAKLAELAGVSRMAITKACKPGKALEAAIQGRYLDGKHPSVVEYLKDKGKAPAKAPGQNPEAAKSPKTIAKKPAAKKPAGKVVKKPKAAPKKPGRPPKPKAKAKPAASQDIPEQGAPLSSLEAFVQSLPDDIREDIRNVQHLPLIEVLNMFGSDMHFKGFADGTKRLEEIYKLQIENKKRSGELVDCALVGVILDIIDATHVSLMNDGSKNMAARAEPKFKAGCQVEEVAQYFQESIAKYIKPMKEQIKRKLQEMKTQ